MQRSRATFLLWVTVLVSPTGANDDPDDGVFDLSPGVMRRIAGVSLEAASLRASLAEPQERKLAKQFVDPT